MREISNGSGNQMLSFDKRRLKHSKDIYACFQVHKQPVTDVIDHERISR